LAWAGGKRIQQIHRILRNPDRDRRRTGEGLWPEERDDKRGPHAEKKKKKGEEKGSAGWLLGRLWPCSARARAAAGWAELGCFGLVGPLLFFLFSILFFFFLF
jgi:hypothetical protein